MSKTREPSNIDRIAPKRPWSGGNERIRALFQPTHEEAVVLVDQRKAAVLEEGQIKQEKTAPQPGAGLEEGTLVGGFVGDLVGDHRLLGDVVNEVQHDAGGVVVSGLELGEELL